MRQKICPACNGTHFKRVIVTLPSGRDRDTVFVYCCRCLLVFFRPEDKSDNIIKPNYARYVPADLVDTIKRALPDPTQPTTSDSLTEHYLHPELGRMALVFKRLQKAGGGTFVWHLDEARLVG